jgi:hypothetical protein
MRYVKCNEREKLMEVTIGNILYLIIVASFIKFGKFLIKADDSKIKSVKSEGKKAIDTINRA